MKHVRVSESLLDKEQIGALYRSVCRTINPGENVIVYDLGNPLLTIFAANSGAGNVKTLSRNKNFLSSVTKNLQDCIELLSDIHSLNEKTDTFITELTDVMFITGDQIKLINSLVIQKVITSKTKVIPLQCNLFFEPVWYDFTFYDVDIPIILEDSDRERCLHIFQNPTMYKQIDFNKITDTKIEYSGIHQMNKKGTFNALKFTCVTHFSEDILIGSTKKFKPIYIPVKTTDVRQGEVVSIDFSYGINQGFNSLKVEIF